jgi:acetylornithine/succinyldiaminopimelate/putrescine aminotransferase/GNAT superfamily N-acetyltransferase
MRIDLINDQDKDYALSILNHFYESGYIPPEKKTYLTDHKNSIGPYLAITTKSGRPHYILDCASQIATLGLGLNHPAFFGCAHRQETWDNNQSSDDFHTIYESYKTFLKRKLDWKELNLQLANSGAEAIETALMLSYQNRTHKDAKKVIAFKGSFHGRMLISLSLTWNPIKRTPFELPGYENTFIEYPELDNDETQLQCPKNWKTTWQKSSEQNFKEPTFDQDDHIIKDEIKYLLEVRQRLVEKETYAIVIEPMQCEGGDRYSSSRFHTALLLMAKSFSVDVIYDEVQTGFHLGKDFFWHKQFNLTDEKDIALVPTTVVCAKKAQIGLILTQHKFEKLNTSISTASFIRGLHHGLLMDQYSEKIIALNIKVKKKLEQLVETHSKYLSRPRSNGLAFAFDLPKNEFIQKFVAARFKYGLLYYPAGDKTLRFRLNLSFKKEDLDFLFKQLDLLCQEIFEAKEIVSQTSVETPHRAPASLYKWHEMILNLKLNINSHSQNEIIETFKGDTELDLVLVDSSNIEKYENDIISFQEKVYEPIRRTPIEAFRKAAKHPKSVCFVATKDKIVQAIAFSSLVSLHPDEKGLKEDPYFNDEDTLYTIDVTVSEEFQGKGIGRYLKYTLAALGLTKGIKRIHGRNRDHLAGAMLGINLSLGAHELFYKENDYSDDEKYRDMIYYSIKLPWEENFPEFIDSHFIAKALPLLNNKVCLSNFVNEGFLQNVETILQLMPKELQQGYTTSGEAECVDKIVKSIWYNLDENRKAKLKDWRMISFEGHSFGTGSAMANCLTGNSDFFPVTKIQAVNDLEKELIKENILAVWLEPITQFKSKKLEIENLKLIRELCTKYKVPLVFNETASQGFEYTQDSFFASNADTVLPDLAMSYLGGQAGMCFTSKEFYIEKPLTLISTWDGDEYSFLYAATAFKHQMKQRGLN